MREARATIFVSTYEGFGIPPVESLHLGIPVISLASTPSLAMLPPTGQIRLPELTVEAVMDGILTLEDDVVAERLWTETVELNLETWRTFAEQSGGLVRGSCHTCRGNEGADLVITAYRQQEIIQFRANEWTGCLKL